jgi:hypothetical protein
MGLVTGPLPSPRRPPLFVSCRLVCEGTRLKSFLAMVIVQCEVGTALDRQTLARMMADALATNRKHEFWAKRSRNDCPQSCSMH